MDRNIRRSFPAGVVLAATLLAAGAVVVVLGWSNWFHGAPTAVKPELSYQPRGPLDTSGYQFFMRELPPWPPDASFEEIARLWDKRGYRLIDSIDRDLQTKDLDGDQRTTALLFKATLFNYEGEPKRAYEELAKLRAEVQGHDALAEKYLFTIIFAQGITSLRRGEDENCIMCRGESSCIFPVAPAAVHANTEGARGAIKHFNEYLAVFPDDVGVQWLMNLASMLLGEPPDAIDPRFRLDLDLFLKSEFDIGRFREVGQRVGLERINMQGGGIMEDFDHDGLLDLVVTANDPTMDIAFYRNRGDGTFEDRSAKAGLSNLKGGLYCVQGDYNNDGRMDIFIPRGAWHPYPVRPSLLRNNGNGTFTDVAKEAGLAAPINSISAAWMDYDNDGQLDLFICCDRQPSRLYRNKGDGSFADVTAAAGLPTDLRVCKGVAWIDYDNDGAPDLFLNYFPDLKSQQRRRSQLFHNNGNGTFTQTTEAMGIDGPEMGFSCWSFDYDNDGWLDLFATSYFFTLEEIVKGLQGQTRDDGVGKLYRNRGGKGFEDVTGAAGLNKVFAVMGSNFGDFDNDGYLDMYLGTGSPDLAMLRPNRMLKNVAGKRFADISVSSGTAHLQKGHSVACGDWRRTGNIDIFHQMGGVTNGDKYHNVLFVNPGQGNHWLTVKLVGQKTNRAAIGARIKAVVAGAEPLTVHRHVSSGSSFGANPLQQTLGLAKAERVALLEIYWPTSGTKQSFRDVAVNQAIEVTEFAQDYRKLDWSPISLPK